jgi:abequosyltransferase
MSQKAKPKLSICIATVNRARFIGSTLETILPQLTPDCEVVVLDGGSTDDTREVVFECAKCCNRLRYVRQDSNNGVDRDYDRAIQIAEGEYCWLMTDDDWMKPGAVSSVLSALVHNRDLVVVNVEFRDFSMSRVLQDRWLDFEADRIYESGHVDRLFEELGDLLWYIGSIIIRRDVWLERERERYYGSLFVYVGVIFQKPLPGNALVIATPQLSYRTGNAHTFSSRIAEILLNKWPSILESLPFSKAAREKIGSACPWASPQWLLLLRAWGVYDLAEYRQWVRPRLSSLWMSAIPWSIAMFPGVLVNTLFVGYYFAVQNRGRWLQAMKASRFNVRHSLVFRAVSSCRSFFAG